MRLLLGRYEDVAQFVADRIPYYDGVEDFGPGVAIGIVDTEGYLRGGWVFHNYIPRFRSIDATAASVGHAPWLTASIISGLFAYPFDQLGVKRLGMVTARGNKAARSCIKKLGFKLEGIARSGFGGSDAVGYSLLASEWRRSRLNVANRRLQKEAA